MKKLTICTISALIMLTAGTAFAAKAEPQPSSRDIQLKNGEWTALAQIYPVPSVSSDVSQALTPERLASWWNVFNDPMMTELVLASLKGNRDLAAARAKVTEARATLGVSQASLLPWLDSTNFWSNGRTPVQAGGSGNSTNLYKLGIDA